MTQENNKDKFLKLFGKGKDEKDKEPIEKPIVLYCAKYIGVLGSNKSFPTEEGAYVRINEDRIDIEILKSKFQTAIPYKNMTDVENIDAGNKVDLERIIGLGVLTAGIGSIVALFWKRHHIITVIKYTDNASVLQVMAIDFLADTKYAQPIIYKKMLETQRIPKIPSRQPSQLFPSPKPPD